MDKKEDGRAGAQGLTRESEVCDISLEERESGWVGNTVLWPAITKGPPEVNAQDSKFQSTWRCIFLLLCSIADVQGQEGTSWA